MINLVSLYPWIKALHIISVMAWMAGLFYLPRLFVYHVEYADKGIALTDTLEIMERRLEKVITLPAMIASWVFGLLLIMTPGIVDWSISWPWLKSICVIGMTLFYFWLSAKRKDLAEGRNTVSGKNFRLMNEVPTLFMVLIVFAVVIKF